jgi:Zn-finger nucleic acid-binding protein
MPRCPLCRSALVTITFGQYPIAICTSCSARWIQDGHQQRVINQVQEPSLMALGRSQPATQPALPRALTAHPGQLLPGGSMQASTATFYPAASAGHRW